MKFLRLLIGVIFIICFLFKHGFVARNSYSGENNLGEVMKDPIFVVQKHAASHLHYDFRLGMNGVLKSWAIPKGPSTSSNDKRLAVMVEDHDLGYAEFEGTIPEGQYGAGTVEIWDKGTYKNIQKDGDVSISMEQALKNGKIKIFLYGQKLHGAYALTRMHSATKGASKQDNWLLVKMKD